MHGMKKQMVICIIISQNALNSAFLRYKMPIRNIVLGQIKKIRNKIEKIYKKLLQ